MGEEEKEGREGQVGKVGYGAAGLKVVILFLPFLTDFLFISIDICIAVSDLTMLLRQI